jgi:ribosomal protein S18 acetylase RimI-like enzyme
VSKNFKASDVSYEKAELSDLEEIVKLSLQVLQLNGLGAIVDVNLSKGSEYLARLLSEEEKLGCILVAKLKGSIVGLLALAEGGVWWSDQRFFTNVVLYVHPKYRKLGIQKRLMDFAKIMSKESRLPFILDFFSLDSKSGIIEEWTALQGFKRLGFKAVYL